MRSTASERQAAAGGVLRAAALSSSTASRTRFRRAPRCRPCRDASITAPTARRVSGWASPCEKRKVPVTAFGAGIEPATLELKIRCSNRLSYPVVVMSESNRHMTALNRCLSNWLMTHRGTPHPRLRHTPRQCRAHRAGVRASAAESGRIDAPHYRPRLSGNPFVRQRTTTLQHEFFEDSCKFFERKRKRPRRSSEGVRVASEIGLTDLRMKIDRQQTSLPRQLWMAPTIAHGSASRRLRGSSCSWR